MTVQEFQKQIRSGDIDRVIILYGEEVAVMDEYLSHLYKAVKVRPRSSTRSATPTSALYSAK